MNKKRFIILIIILSIITYPFQIKALVEKDSYNYAIDDAGLMSDDTKDYIEEYSKFLYKECKVNITVLIVKDLEDFTLEDYAAETFKYYGMTEKDILFLISKSDNKFRIQVGKETSPYLTNKTVEKYINEFILPYFKNSEWNEGILNGYNALYKRICSLYNIDSSAMEVYDGTAFLNKYKYIIISVIVMIGTLLANIFSNFLIMIFKIKKRIDTFDMFILILSIAINFLLLFLLYILVPKSIIIMLTTELLVGYSSYNLYNESRIKKKKKTKKHNKKEKINKRKNIPQKKEKIII